MKQLYCKIVEMSPPNWRGERNLRYVVFDEEKQIHTGISSTPDWVKHDAGGYHTKSKFDAMYPEGWKVNFNF